MTARARSEGLEATESGEGPAGAAGERGSDDAERGANDGSLPAGDASLPRGVVKLATVSIVPWTLGSLLSPFGEPHPVMLALPPAALILVILVVRFDAPVHRAWVGWLFTGILLAASLTRFIGVPIASEVFTGGEDLDLHGRGIEGVMLFLALTKLVFYVASLGLVVFCGWVLRPRRRPSGG